MGKRKWGLLAARAGCGIVALSLLSGCSYFRGMQAVLDASSRKGAVPLRVEFRLRGSFYGRPEAGTFTLDFGDGTEFVQGTDLGVSIPHVYDHAGTYEARLTLLARDGRSAESIVFIVVAELSELTEGSAVGDRARDFAAPTTEGADVTLSGLRGQVVLLEFWGSWCNPCRASMPHINTLWEEYHDEGFVVLAVSTDTRAEDSTAYLERNGFTGLICVWEPGGKSTPIKLLYEVDWIPRSVVIDRKGVVRYNAHPMDLEGDFIEGLLAEPVKAALGS